VFLFLVCGPLAYAFGLGCNYNLTLAKRNKNVLRLAPRTKNNHRQILKFQTCHGNDANDGNDGNDCYYPWWQLQERGQRGCNRGLVFSEECPRQRLDIRKELAFSNWTTPAAIAFA
jgi:hypothetical protein